jgi:dTDP-4-amino-4,6-dideoxygalactose transaminase
MMEESKYKYNSWPLGKVPIELQRPEIYKLKELGYEFDDARDVVDIFENKVAEFAGSTYAVSVDSCSHGIFLCIKYLQSIGEIKKDETIIIPNRTYVSIPMQIIHAGLKLEYQHIEWSGLYQLTPTRIVDSAVRWKKDMYLGDDVLQVISFQFKKPICIGKGGIILTNDFDAYSALRLMRYDGRNMELPYDHPNHTQTLGYHMYMEPESAARGIILMDSVKFEGDSGNYTMYPDVEKMMNNIKL